MAKRISDQERLEYVKQYKASGLSVSEFAKRNNLARCTLRDWINAFESISGDFIQVNPSLAEKGDFMKTEEVRMNMLSQEQITGKSNHFTRFDHSVVVKRIQRAEDHGQPRTCQNHPEGLLWKR